MLQIVIVCFRLFQVFKFCSVALRCESLFLVALRLFELFQLVFGCLRMFSLFRLFRLSLVVGVVLGLSRFFLSYSVFFEDCLGF